METGLKLPTADADRVAAEPYLHLTRTRDGFRVRGALVRSLGHEIHDSSRAVPDGVFASWHWDGKILRVRNDRYGCYPLYYFTRPGEIGLSTSVWRLLALGAPDSLDEAGVAVFLRLGFFVGEDTPFRFIRVVPPNASFEWDEGGLRLSSRLALGAPQHRSRDEIIDAYIELFRAAIRRRLPNGNHFMVPLSGGKDSRHIVLELCEAGFPPECVTFRHYPPRSDDDADIASSVTRALGLPHVVLSQRKSKVREELRKNRLTSFCTDEHVQYLVLADYLKQRPDVQILYDGIAGDILSSGNHATPQRLALFEAGRFAHLAAELLSCHGDQGVVDEPMLLRLLGRESYQRFGRDVAVERLQAELRRHGEAPNPAKSFFFWNRDRREISLIPCCIYADVTTVFCPYLDHELYDLLVSIPGGGCIERDLHADTVRRAYPRASHIPFERYRTVGDRWHARRYAADFAFYALCRSEPWLIRRSYLVRPLLRCLADGNYNRLQRIQPLVSLYLLQLGNFILAVRERSAVLDEPRPRGAEGIRP